MTSTLKKFITAASASGLLAAGVVLGTTATAQAVPGGPSGCTAFLKPGNSHIAEAWCKKGNGYWNVQAKCAGPGSTHGPYKGDPGFRALSREKAAVLSCGSGYPVELKVVDIHV
ncbi:hypothetical protein C3489_22825 [Streptomyces sp. Ru71]|uniref:hypothetical protein n=1 Tax=Streptomyces sp. Ru71 TaxID=2080746 RepID=UPI000CDE38FC|nr:hypothetical protein [Streptomyces sp. Ru71]POX50275.1 hypothetical protein C3489_22825 [Streptomyces sp. Ru71]